MFILHLKIIISLRYIYILKWRMSSNIVQPLQQASGKESEKQSKACWDDITMDTFIKVYVNDTLASNRSNSHFSKLRWKNVIKAFNNLIGRNYQYRQLKNKWSSLKKDWQLWNTLIGKETNLRWDPMKQTINASNEWWDKKLKVCFVYSLNLFD